MTSHYAYSELWVLEECSIKNHLVRKKKKSCFLLIMRPKIKSLMEVLTDLVDKFNINIQKPCNCNAKHQGYIM